MSTISYSKAISDALREEMARDEKVILMGEDIGFMGGVWGITRGFLDQFGPKRIIETPIAENSFMGMGVGAAMRGLRPVVELMYIDFLLISMDAVVNQAAKMRYMTGGQINIPLVIRAPQGAGRRNAGQHSQSLEGMLTHVPGLKVICPATPYDAKGMLKSAVQDDDPVFCIEHKMLYATNGEVPDEEYLIPIGKADVKRPGCDLTIITWSREVLHALQAAKNLEAAGISAEIIDLRSLVPLDFACIAESVQKTHRVLVVHEAVKRGGFGAEIASQINEELFDELDAPVMRLAGLNVVSPFSPGLEDYIFPNADSITAAAMSLCK